jgi:endonuclease/exonuclease/phosphatase family metal-dependent hydrolase
VNSYEYSYPKSSCVVSIDFEIFRLSLDKLTNGKPKHVIIAGDFNCPDIDWANMEIKTGASDREVQLALLHITSEYGLTQIHDKPTYRMKLCVDLCCF